MGTLPDCEYWSPHHRWDHPLKAATIRRQFRFNNRVVVIDDRVANCCNRAERAQRLRGKHRANNLKVLVRPLHPHAPIGDLLKFLHSLLPMRDGSVEICHTVWTAMVLYIQAANG